jgi:rubrerythrin
MDIAFCDALRVAFEFEQENEQLYRKQLEKVTDEFARKVLEFLANEEADHAKKIEAFNDALLGDGKFDLDKECSIGVGLRAKQLLKDWAAAEDKKITSDSNDLDIYDIAMDMEKKSYSVYERALADSKNLNDDRLNRFFTFLIAEEKEHYNILAASKKYLEDPAYYFLDYGGWVFS